MSAPDRRPSSAELVRDVAVAGLQRAPAPPEHTVGLTLNAKGDVQIEVTGRGADLAALSQDVSVTFDELRRRYPRVENERAEKSEGARADSEARAAAAIARSRAKS